jgi:hypothetical protein
VLGVVPGCDAFTQLNGSETKAMQQVHHREVSDEHPDREGRFRAVRWQNYERTWNVSQNQSDANRMGGPDRQGIVTEIIK